MKEISYPGDTLLRVGSHYACIDIYFIADRYVRAHDA